MGLTLVDDLAFSEEAQTLRERLAPRVFAGSSILLSRRLETLAELRRAADAGELDPTVTRPSPETFDVTEAFIAALPANIPDPDLVPEPDGELAVEWQFGRRWVFSVSIGPRHRLSYAGLFGGNRSHGAEQFTGEIPEAIKSGLSRLLRHSLVAV